MIPLSKPFINKSDLKYFRDVFESKILTDGKYQSKSEVLIKKMIKSKFIALTHSCTAALEISALLLNLKKGDEVLLPSYGFVSISNAVALRGATPVFVEVDPKSLNICLKDLEKKITKKTVAIYLIHYAGNSCDMDRILYLKKKYKIYLVEDTAHAFLSKFKNKYLGTIGDIGTFSFHETKNVTCGQGGCLSVNNTKLIKRANYILDKGTDRRDFIKNYKKKIITSSNSRKFYSWVDLGSEYRAPELSSALLFSQLKKVNIIQKKRKIIWKKYKKLFNKIKSDQFTLIEEPKNITGSYHLLALLFDDLEKSNRFKKYLQKKNIAATFHYVPLHTSKMGRIYSNKKLPITEKIYKKVVRLPLFAGMTSKEFHKIEKSIKNFF